MIIESNKQSEADMLQLLKNPYKNTDDKELAITELAKNYTLAKNLTKLEYLFQLSKTIAPEDSKIYQAKIFKIILTQVSENDTKDKILEVAIAKKILDWAVNEKKQFLINKLRLTYANVLY